MDGRNTSRDQYFQVYVDEIRECLRKVKKIGGKKYFLIKEVVDEAEANIQKEVYGRVEPAVYLMTLMLALGSRNPKLYAPIIGSIQNLFSNNFIVQTEDLSIVVRSIKQEQTQLLLLPLEDYQNKTFKELFIESLINLTERDEQITLTIIRNFSLIWRLSERSLSSAIAIKIFDFIIEAIFQNKNQDTDKLLKSALLEIVRHSFECYKEAFDQRFLNDENDVSVQKLCSQLGRVLCDKVALVQKAKETHGVQNYSLIPQNPQNFVLLPLQQVNQNGHQNGKFGWCIVCRKAAPFYCRINRVPVCSFQCKTDFLNEERLLEKLIRDEKQAMSVYEQHILLFCKLFSKYLLHPDMRRRESFADGFTYIASEFKKITQLKPKILQAFRGVLVSAIQNVYCETEVFTSCLNCVRKMMSMRGFVGEFEVFFNALGKKLIHFMTPDVVKQEILAFCRELVSSGTILDYFIAIDCKESRDDSLRSLMEAVAAIYIGVPLPEGVAPPPENQAMRKFAYDIIISLFGILRNCQKQTKDAGAAIQAEKSRKSRIRQIIQRFNSSEKPLKIINILIKQGELSKQPSEIAHFLRTNLKKLRKTNVGILIGDWDTKLAIPIRNAFVAAMNFKDLTIDEGLRRLLADFTMPGESQVVERLIECFSLYYYQANVGNTVFSHPDSVYSFSYLLMMLQTNLHNPQVIEKMTLEQYSGLSKTMNGPNKNYPDTPNVDYPADFLEKVYKSIEARQLGFHEKAKDAEILTMYAQNPKKAQQLYIKDLETEWKRINEVLLQAPCVNAFLSSAYPAAPLCEELMELIVKVATQRAHQVETKEDIQKALETVEIAMTFSCECQVPYTVQLAFQHVWDELTKLPTMKKHFLMEVILEWVRKFSNELQSKWQIVIYIISKFNSSKLIKKDIPNSKTTSPVFIAQQKCYLYESYIELLFAKSNTYELSTLKHIILALLEIGKQEIAQDCHPFCIDKVTELLDINTNRLADIVPLAWSQLCDYYVEMGSSKNEKVAIFGADFLKQVVTKFLKRKDVLQHQRDFMKPFEAVFKETKSISVKEYIISSLLSFVNNYSPHLKIGWKTIFGVMYTAFDQDEHIKIKEKAFSILRKIYDSKFTILSLEEHYSDFIQILGRIAREKEENFPKGCLEAVRATVEYLRETHSIDLSENRQPNPRLSINFWQTVWLPLLSAIYGICGDSRQGVQHAAIELLFQILQKYGVLFEKQFWTMILQGVIRPTFEEITFTSQSKQINKNELEKWLKNSFEALFSAINELIFVYFGQFRLFLNEVFKIYESCTIYFTNKVLVELSITAIGELLSNIGPKFRSEEWQQFIAFVDNIMKKTIPQEIMSLEIFHAKEKGEENVSEGKCFALHLFIAQVHQILSKHQKSIPLQVLVSLQAEVTSHRETFRLLNLDIELRKQLWSKGFYSELQSLPGLIKQEHEILKLLSNLSFWLRTLGAEPFEAYKKHTLGLLREYKTVIEEQVNRSDRTKLEERDKRISFMQSILLENVFPQIDELGLDTFKNCRQELFGLCMCLIRGRNYCRNCINCETCEANSHQNSSISQKAQSVLEELFLIR